MIPSVTSSEFDSFCQQNNPYILDVRTHFEYSDGHIEGAYNIPIQFLSNSIQEIPKDRCILVYCLHGVRSLKAASFLHLKGFKEVYHLEGGLSTLE